MTVTPPRCCALLRAARAYQHARSSNGGQSRTHTYTPPLYSCTLPPLPHTHTTTRGCYQQHRGASRANQNNTLLCFAFLISSRARQPHMPASAPRGIKQRAIGNSIAALPGISRSTRARAAAARIGQIAAWAGGSSASSQHRCARLRSRCATLAHRGALARRVRAAA
jgi:hypothetical protein